MKDLIKDTRRECKNWKIHIPNKLLFLGHFYKAILKQNRSNSSSKKAHEVDTIGWMSLKSSRE